MVFLVLLGWLLFKVGFFGLWLFGLVGLGIGLFLLVVF